MLTVFILALLLAVPAAGAEGEEATVLFTHDLHSHLLPARDEDGASYGGYARLKTVIDDQRELYPDALLVDGGDFSMGSLFQTVYATDAAELRIMGELGYDAVTFGNHEFDYRAGGFADMLNAAVDSGERLPALLEANYRPLRQGEEGCTPDSAAAREAMDRAGVETGYTVIERGGVHFALFGIMGRDSHSCAPMSGMALEDPAETARAVIARIEAEVPQPRVVVCLSHSGIWEETDKSEDELLAKEAPGIDILVSGHTHTTLEAPIRVGDTHIVSCGDYSRNLGRIRLRREGEGWVLTDYSLLPIDDAVAEDPAIAQRVETYKGMVEENYLSRFGDLTYDRVLAENPHAFGSMAELNLHRESTLGNLIADSYRWAVEQAEGKDYIPVDFALTANGVIRASLPQGELTVADVFDVCSLGIGADKVPGYPLVAVWITGEDLKNAFEVDASVTAIMPAAQLYFTGMTYTANMNRMIFNKVIDCAQILPDGSAAEIKDDRLYRVATGLYCGQMLGAVNDQSFGILSITPRDAQGREITDLEEFIVHDRQGREVKEWYALASYLESMGTVDQYYAATHARKNLSHSLNPAELVKNPNGITLAVWAVGLVLLLAAVWGVRRVGRSVKRRKLNRG